MSTQVHCDHIPDPVESGSGLTVTRDTASTEEIELMLEAARCATRALDRRTTADVEDIMDSSDRGSVVIIKTVWPSELTDCDSLCRMSHKKFRIHGVDS